MLAKVWRSDNAVSCVCRHSQQLINHKWLVLVFSQHIRQGRGWHWHTPEADLLIICWWVVCNRESREATGKEESPGSGCNEDPTGFSNLRWQIGSLHWRTILASGWRPPLKAEISCGCPSPSFTSSDFLALLLIARNTHVFKHRGLVDKKPPEAQATKKGTERRGRVKVHIARAHSCTGVLDHCWQKYNPTVPWFPGNELNEHARGRRV